MAQKTAISLEGQTFGRLKVLWRSANKVEPSGATRAAWQCQCECGNGVIVTGHSLTKGHTRSCGCLTKEKPIKHGKSYSSVYRIWAAMVQRCENPNMTNYHSYGGRGVTVHESWKAFDGFYADMGEPEPGMTLDRIDNEKGYGPGNCRWASRREQANNRRTNTVMTFNDKSLTIAEWSRLIGIEKSTLIGRINRGWSVEKVLTTLVEVRKSSTSRKD